MSIGLEIYIVVVVILIVIAKFVYYRDEKITKQREKESKNEKK